MKKILLIILATVLYSVAASAQIASPDMYRKGTNLCIDGDRLIPDQVLALIGNDNFFETYLGAQRQFRAGRALLISGACVTALGIGTYGVAVAGLDQVTGVCGLCLIAAGSVLLDAGIPLLCIGKSRLNWCAEDYDRRVSGCRFPGLSLDFGSHRYGTGLALKF